MTTLAVADAVGLPDYGRAGRFEAGERGQNEMAKLAWQANEKDGVAKSEL
jgi:hypothetical protein